MFGANRKESLRATQTTRPKIDRTTGRLRLCCSNIQDGDARCASHINGDQQILFLIEGVDKGEHVNWVAPVAQLSDHVPTNVSAILQSGQGEAHQRCAAVDGEQVRLTPYLFDELPNDRGACLEFPVDWVPYLNGARFHLSTERVRDPVQ